MPEELREDSLDMSPEEMRELQKKQCIFCHIVSGRVASRKVYEDDRCVAILDINPANPGHVLLLPKEHYSIMPQMEDEITEHMFVVVKHLSHSLLKALKAEGTYIFVANGVVAGQKAAHFMIHIIPRKEGDGLQIDIPEHVIKENQLRQIRDILIQKTSEKAEGIVMESEEAEQKPEISPEKPKVIEAEFDKKADLDAVSALIAKKGIIEDKKRKLKE